MTEPRSLSRRDVIATIAGGALLGGAWAVAFPALATETRPTVTVIGHHDAQLILVDSTEGRALVLVGDPEDELLDTLPAMMTLFRQRIDIVIGSRQVIERRAIHLRDRWLVQRAFSLQSAVTLPSLAMQTTTITQGTEIDLGAGLTITCDVGHRDEWRIDALQAATPLWSLAVRHPAGTLMIAPDAASLNVSSRMDAVVLFTPALPPTKTLRRFPSIQAVAVNYDAEMLESRSLDGRTVTRIYPDDIARFTLDDHEIRLPHWSGSAKSISSN